MTAERLVELFAKYENEHLKYDCIEKQRSKRPDMHAFMLLDELLPDSDSDMVSCAEHDEIYLEPSTEDLAEVVSEEQVLELIRCGLRYDSSTDGFAMFV